MKDTTKRPFDVYAPGTKDCPPKFLETIDVEVETRTGQEFLTHESRRRIEEIRARHMGLADELRMERDLVRHCFHLRPGSASDTVEGIRALAVDKDHSPQWSPARQDSVAPEMVAPFFVSPWPAHAHPLRYLR